MTTQRSETDNPRRLKRLTVTIDGETDDALEAYVKLRQVSKAEALRRLVIIGKTVIDAMEGGAKVRFEYPERIARLRVL